MEEKKRERNRCLLLWIASLPTFAQNGVQPKIENFKDGAMTARILKNNIDPVYFKDLNDSPKESTELVKVVDKMKKYLAAAQTDSPIATNLVPNCGKIIASGDLGEINRLLQFILACAVNSQRKDSFVTGIMQMEEKVQFDLMEAIQELLQKDEKLDLSEIEFRSGSRSEIATLNEIIERLSQENHEVRTKLAELSEEKTVLVLENERMGAQLAAHLSDPDSIHVSLRQTEEFKKETEKLREENYRLETVVDDLKIKLQVLEKQMLESQSKVALCTSLQDELLRLKDESDSLREAATKVSQYETSIQQYKKRLEGLDFLKRNIKDLEEKNEELHKTNIHLEEDMKKSNSWKNKVEDVKKKLIETQQALSQENQKSRRLEFDNKLLREKYDNLQALSERLSEEKSNLRQQFEELRVNPNASAELAALHPDSVNSIDLLPTQIRQKLTRLELENGELRKQVESGALLTSDEGSRVLVEQLRRREAELDEELLAKTQEVIDIKSSYGEKVRRLETLVLAKEEELKKKENQYKKCMDKAKSVIVSLEPTAGVGLEGGSSVKGESEGDRSRAVREMEEKLLASAFYSYSLNLQKNAVETRNSATILSKARNNASSRRKSEM